MNKQSRFLFVVSALIAVLVSACGGAAASTEVSETSTGSGKPLASLVEFTGVIEAMDGNQWTVNGQVFTVDPSVLRDGPFEIGDTVKVEAEVQADGSVVVTRVEPPVASADDNANDNANDNTNSSLGNVNGNDNTNSSLGNVNGNDNTNSSIGGNSNDNSNDDDSNDDNSNDDDSNNDNSNSDDDGNDDGDNGDDDDNGSDD